MREKFKNIPKVLGAVFGLQDFFVFGGLSAAGYGIYQIHEPSAFIAVGVSVAILGLFWR